MHCLQLTIELFLAFRKQCIAIEKVLFVDHINVCSGCRTFWARDHISCFVSFSYLSLHSSLTLCGYFNFDRRHWYVVQIWHIWQNHQTPFLCAEVSVAYECILKHIFEIDVSVFFSFFSILLLLVLHSFFF